MLRIRIASSARYLSEDLPRRTIRPSKLRICPVATNDHLPGPTDLVTLIPHINSATQKSETWQRSEIRSHENMSILAQQPRQVDLSYLIEPNKTWLMFSVKFNRSGLHYV